MSLSRRQFLISGGLLFALPWAKNVASQEARILRIGTASTAGIYFPIGGLIASAISSPPGSRECERGGSCGVPNLIATAQSTEGSAFNVAAIEQGNLETALAQADVAFWAYHAEGPYEGRDRMQNLRTIANLYPEVIQVVTREDSEIESPQDLAGKRISLDQKGSGSLVDALLILEAWGLSPDDFEASYLAPNVAASQLRKGELDGFFMVAGTPTPAINDLTEEVSIRLLRLEGEPVERLQSRYPFFSTAEVSEGTYEGVPGTPSLSVGAQWLVDARLEEELVFQMTRAFWHPMHRKLFEEGHPQARRISLDTALNGLGAPLHPGAKRYYESIGITIIEPYETE
ncbi:TAXI family TRAP transporter solute-binding subunit [Fodinicurvata sediminis]|uniref:TAXI family TRAP transporter solute-binding subunit n=1 Tax=Fodinicurvata sediminis TaxID=1121832 RepID=UPI0004258FE3|nr:TAXI family TRAP transporter solute-binding subunit [Fodinicurvata sediminis]